MHSLPLFVRLTGRPVILIGAGDAAAAKRRLIERAGGVIVDESASASLAIVALDEPEPRDAVVARLKARGILVNVVDQPGDCDFTLPAILDRDPVLIAIGTGGASAGLAKALRQRLETLLPARLGALATALATARGAIRARWADPADRRRAIDAALEAGGSLDPLTPDSATHVDAWLTADAAAATRDRLEICTIASADPDQLTLQVARWLASADSVFHQPGIAPAILDRARADARRIAHPGPALPEPEGLSLYLVTR